MIGPSIAALALVLSSSCVIAADVGLALSSPMIDWSIYREGQVRRLNARFGEWRMTCDEIVSLKQRFCSLRSEAKGDDDLARTAMDVSTGDNGHPAALLHLPLGIAVGYGVDVAMTNRATDHGPGRPKVKVRKLGIVTCTARECLAVWSLGPLDVQGLSEGGDIRLTVCQTIQYWSYTIDIRVPFVVQ